MARAFRRCGSVLAVALILAAPVHAASNAHVRTGASLVHALESGRRLVLRGVTVTGPVDLRNVDTVKRLFECQACTFEGPVLAHDVTFDRAVDLSGSIFASTVNFAGATFNGPALFRAGIADETTPSKPPCRFHADANFSLAVFNDLASFGNSRFCGTADFRDARFSDGTFSWTWFGPALFLRASFRGSALFNDAHFTRHASFYEVDFRSHVDFANAQFYKGADFSAARFADGGSFLIANFTAAPSRGLREAATFEGATSSGDLNFTFATFDGGIATFSGFVSSGALVLHAATFDISYGVAMDQLQVRQLVLDVAAVKGISDEQQRMDVLSMIEGTAKERQDLRTANDAHYEERVLRAKQYPPVLRALDYVFYRGVAGYFVRPLRPIAVLLLIVMLVAVLRMRARGRATVASPQSTAAQPKGGGGRSEAAPRARWQRWQRAGRRCGSFFTCLLDTLALAAPRRGDPGERTLLQRIEILAYRLLVVCALIGIANSNPTLRQMVDSFL